MGNNTDFDLNDLFFIERIATESYGIMLTQINPLYINRRNVDKLYDILSALGAVGNLYLGLLSFIADKLRVEDNAQFDPWMYFGDQALNEYIYYGTFFTYQMWDDESSRNVIVKSMMELDVLKVASNTIVFKELNNFYHILRGLSSCDVALHVSQGAKIGTLTYVNGSKAPSFEYEINVNIPSESIPDEPYKEEYHACGVYYVDY